VKGLEEGFMWDRQARSNLVFVIIFDSLQTAVAASTENRKQAQEQSQEKQQQLINLQHDLNQVTLK